MWMLLQKIKKHHVIQHLLHQNVKKLVEAMTQHKLFDSNSIARKCLKAEPLKGPYDNL